MITILLAGLLAAAMISPAHAQQSEPADGKGAYAGFGVTHSEHEWMSGDANQFKFFGGYNFSERWGVEAGTARQGEWSVDTPPGTLGYHAHYKGRVSYVAAKLSAPLSEKWAFEGKLGMAHASGTLHIATSGVPGPYERAESSNNLYAAMGLKYKLSPRTFLSLELERNGKQRDGGPKNEAVSLNLGYRF